MDDHLRRYCEIFQLDSCAAAGGNINSSSNSTIDLEDGGTYYGQVNSALVPHGNGHELYPHGGKRYDGQFLNGSKTGKGTFFYQNGLKAYQGQFRNNHMHGPGSLFDPTDGSIIFNGSLFHGSIFNGSFFN